MNNTFNDNELVLLCTSEASLKTMLPNCSLDIIRQTLRSNQILLYSKLDEEADLLFARELVKHLEGLSQLWVYDVGGMQAINFASGLLLAHNNIRVSLFEKQASGSFMSRAHAAGIFEVAEPDVLRSVLLSFIEQAGEDDAENTNSSAPKNSTQYKHSCAHPDREAWSVYSGFNEDAHCKVVHNNMYTLEEEGLQECASLECAEELSEECPTVLLSNSFAPHTEIVDSGKPKALQRRASKAFFMPVVSAVGGCGKSTIAALSTLLSVKCGYKTLLIDASFQFGVMRELLPSAVFIDDTSLQNKAFVSKLLDEHQSVPFVVPVSAETEYAEIAATHLESMLLSADSLFDVVIIDTSSYWFEQHIMMLNLASKALFVLDQRASSIEASRRALSLCSRCGIASAPIQILVNKCHKRASLNAQEAALRLGTSNVFEVLDGGDAVERSAALGRLEDLIQEHNDLAYSLEELLLQMLPGASVLQTSSFIEQGIFDYLVRFARRKVASCLC